MFLDELISILVSAHVGVYGTNIFKSSKAVIPSGGGPYLTVTATGGSGPEGTHNATGLPAYQRPTAQLLARATNYSDAEAMAYAAYTALVSVRNQFVQGVWWRQVGALQEPFDFGVDGSNRATVVFNIAVVKRPNAAVNSTSPPSWMQAGGWFQT